MDKPHLLSLSDNSTYPYQLINSNRAKYIRIKLSNQGDLSVVVPLGISKKRAHDFVKNKALWIEKHLQQLTISDKPSVIDSIELKLLNETWSIDYQSSQENFVELEECDNFNMLIRGDVKNLALNKEVIHQWLKQKSRHIFTQMLSQIAEQHGFHYQRLSIRAQKTRWGSCSTKKNINLNCKLLLMPENVVRYVMIHELCHTLEMNHSQRFWSLVEDCDPDYKMNRKVLKSLEKEMIL